MDILKAIVLQLISPLNLSLVALALSFVLVYFHRLKTAKVLRIFSLFWILLCSQPYFGELLLYPLEYHKAQRTVEAQKPDIIYVLACYYSTQGDVSEISRWAECSLQRNVEAVRLHFQTNSPILVTGGHFLDDESVNYTSKVLEFMTSLNVPEDKILGTHKGTTTLEEIKSAHAILKDKNVWVVSSATHVRRLNSMLEPIVNSALYFPVDYKSKSHLTPYISMPSQQALEKTRMALYAYLSELKYKFLAN